MKTFKKASLLATLSLIALGAVGNGARAEDVIKFGLSLPLSGSGAVWGKGAEWMCQQAAREIKESGGVKVGGKAYNIECVAYDNKYTAAEGTKVAQTLINRDGVKYIVVVGGAPALATQSLTERQGVLFFNQAWGKSSKGPQFPLTFSIINSPVEIMPAMIKFITTTYPQAKTIALLNPTDSTGKETEALSHPLWEKAGIKVVNSDFYERGTTEFQPIAQRLFAAHTDIIDLSSAPPADAGMIYKELDLLGYKGVKISDNGTGVEQFLATGGKSVEGVYMGAAQVFDGPNSTEHQRKLNDAGKAYIGESLSISTNGTYDAVYMLKAGAEKAQSLEPKAIAAAMPTVTFRSFYADNTKFGGKEAYGSVQQPQLPVYITQIVDGKLVDRARVDPQ
jgi:branched-chain amino acid transport system substrate-binding protein